MTAAKDVAVPAANIDGGWAPAYGTPMPVRDVGDDIVCCSVVA